MILRFMENLISFGVDDELLFTIQLDTVIELEFRGLLFQQAVLLFVDGWEPSKAIAQAQHCTAHTANLYEMIPHTYGWSE